MPNFNITITPTGGIVIKAPTMQEAFEKYSKMTRQEIEEHAQLTGWEASDADEL
ncbi:hypothetical protein [Anaerotignum sp.]|uniref:hypothetical protein n=1 Tax=Anaerotignum sp. TaxID=2039241 RepID=UPI0028AABB28|nr:hypothetical protein [Anaerotignum sp.]